MYDVPVYKKMPVWVDVLHFFFVALPVAAIVISCVYLVFLLNDCIKWVRSVISAVRFFLYGKTTEETDIVKHVGYSK